MDNVATGLKEMCHEDRAGWDWSNIIFNCRLLCQQY